MKARKNTKISGAAAADGRPTSWTVKVCQKQLFGIVCNSFFHKLYDKDIGILVNNVGVAYDRLNYFHEFSKENMWNMINVNVCSTTMMTKMILPGMLKKKRGAIINISSVAAMGPQPFATIYSATKAYVDFFSRGTVYILGQ